MLSYAIGMLVGLSLATLAIISFKRKMGALPGAIYHISLDAQDLALIKAGKVCNARMSNNKAMADSAHGETGFTVIVKETF